MNRKIWLGALAGATAALLAWLISLPFLPVKQVSQATTLSQASQDAAASFTLGTFFGWFSNLLFGALAGLFIALVYANARTSVDRLRSVLTATLLGAVLVCAADASSDWLGIQMITRTEGSVILWPLVYVLWAFLLAAGLCSALVLAMGLRTGMVMRLLVAVGFGTVAALVLRGIADAATAMIVAPMLLRNASVNSWMVAAPGFLASNIAIGVAAGACMGIAEALTRPAWLHVSLAYGEGYTWTLDWPVTRIGWEEGIEVRVQEMQGLAPVHAQIQRHGADYAIQDLGFGVRLNGHQIPSAWLADNDVVTLGPYEFIFHLRRPVDRRSYDLPPGAIVVTSETPRERNSQQEPMRFEDDFDNSYPLTEHVSIVGRDESCEVCLTWDTTVSRKHAEIILGPNGAMIRDLASSNGTRLNGTVIQSVKVPLKEGDVVEFGTARLTFRE